jgi:hypothetical protein
MTEEITNTEVRSSLDEMTPEQRQTSVDILDADTQRKVEEDKDLPF